MKINKVSQAILSTLTLSLLSPIALAGDEGKATLDFRLRYESVEQDNAAKDADALTLRTRLNYKTATYNNFSAFVEFEDSRAVGVDDYNDTNGNGTEYSVIADPEHTEVDQAYVQYKANGLTAKVGRQVITLDNHRFVGHVGWRQDKQTFDAASFSYKASDKFDMTYAYISKRNRIFGEEKDLDAKDHLINLSYKTAYGKLTGYSYMLEVDEGADNSLDTYGIRFAGAKKSGKNKWVYAAEFATQESDNGSTEYDADYMLAELGYVYNGITIKGGYEVLGSDNGNYGFSTPLATLHKFNGWADQFLGTPSQGLADMYASVSGKAYGGKWAVVFHNYEADEDKGGVDDLGDEINISYGKSFNKTFSGGIKYASYSAGDIKVDADKLWVWVGAKF
ncbi:alginate export family protein [Thalassotalea sp. M1531]|uniref:Alginate export family protein n=1 Tax=Thalassotalea algicola TaxID=2716224 RepID=A0A7Y0LE04_9GAMM|nr:alginate export family protein [Thalassotalea algicola]NMP32453.1 alginate export family protein [Thalassotalea algicola]